MKQLSCLLAAVLLLTAEVAAQPAVPNGGFEQSSSWSPTRTAHWKAESEDFSCIADNKAPYRGAYSLKVSSKTAGNHFFNAEAPFSTEGLKKYRIRCAFRTKNLAGELQLGARVFDAEGGTLTKTVFVLTRNATQDWTTAEGTFVSDLSAAKLRIYGNIAGTGEAWFDEIGITELPPPETGIRPEVALYIHEFFDYIYEASIVDDRFAIANLKARTAYLCSDSLDLEGCQDILKYYTTPSLKDGHSFFTTKDEWKAMMEGGKHPRTGAIHHDMPEGSVLKEDIALIRVPMFISSDEKLMKQYADTLQAIIARADRRGVKGFIIDLSENGGGNCFPMLAGLGPLIGNGVCGYSFSADGSERTLIHNDGWTGWDSTLMFFRPGPYKLEHPGKPVAVIFGPHTGSSGEVTAIAFIGLENSRSFGQPSAGATTRVDNLEMRDGAVLNLAAGVDADRNKNRFGGKLKPDEEAAGREGAIAAARRWILERSN